MIVQIDKKNSVKSDLTSKRNIHTKAEIPKMFGNIVTTAMKPIVIENLTKFQIEAIPGHRSEEHLFTLKSIAAQAEKNDVALAVELLDLSKYFDKECLIDTMNELYNVKVKVKLYRLVYELNKETKFKVRTPVGESGTREVKETIGQGTTEAGIVSSVNLCKGVDDFFETSEEEISYGNINLLPQSFQDDLCCLCLDPRSAQYGLDCFENLANSKLLKFNPLKSFVVILGKKRARKKLEEKFLRDPPLRYGKHL